MKKIVHAYRDGFRRAFDYRGRSRRRDFWYFALASNLVAALLLFTLGSTVSWLYAVIALPAVLGMSVRRLHDTDRSGWWTVATFLPLIGLITAVFWLLAGTPGDNRYGSDPKADPEADELREIGAC